MVLTGECDSHQSGLGGREQQRADRGVECAVGDIEQALGDRSFDESGAASRMVVGHLGKDRGDNGIGIGICGIDHQNSSRDMDFIWERKAAMPSAALRRAAAALHSSSSATSA